MSPTLCGELLITQLWKEFTHLMHGPEVGLPKAKPFWNQRILKNWQLSFSSVWLILQFHFNLCIQTETPGEYITKNIESTSGFTIVCFCLRIVFCYSAVSSNSVNTLQVFTLTFALNERMLEIDIKKYRIFRMNFFFLLPYISVSSFRSLSSCMYFKSNIANFAV